MGSERVTVPPRDCPVCGKRHVLASDVNEALANSPAGTVVVEDTVVVHEIDRLQRLAAAEEAQHGE